MSTSPGPKEFPETLKEFLEKHQNKIQDPCDIVWKIVQECGEEERHFNNLQSVYRGLASTWLLATFGAVGFLFGKETTFDDKNIVSVLVCLAGAIGISLIWMLDLLVYHKLLVAVFREGRKLESIDWLPRFRTNMHSIGREKQGSNTEDEKHDPIFLRLSIYYLVTILVPVFAGAVFALKSYERGLHPGASAFLFTLLIAYGIGISLFIILQVRQHTEEMAESRKS